MTIKAEIGNGYGNTKHFRGIVAHPGDGSVAQQYPTLCDPMNRSMPGLPVHHQFPAQSDEQAIMDIM